MANVSPGPVEVRVHGIGNHDLWSAMGSIETIDGRPKDRVSLARPPEPMVHNAVLVNWARMQHQSSASRWSLWFVALPFTLINLASRMEPAPPPNSTPRAPRGSVHRVIVLSAGVVATITAAIWLSAIFERIFLVLGLPEIIEVARRYLGIGVGTTLLAAIMITRLRRRESRAHARHAWIHVGVVLTFGAIIAAWRPAQKELPENGSLYLFAALGVRDETLAELKRDPSRVLNKYDAYYWVDPIAVVAYGSVLLTVIAVIILVMVASRDQKGPWAGSALALALSTITLNMFGSALLNAVDRQVVPRVRRTEWLAKDDLSYSPDLAIVTGRFEIGYGTRILPLYLAFGLAMILVAILVASRAPIYRLVRFKKYTAKNMHWLHKAITVNLSARILGATFWSVVLAAMAGMATFPVILNRIDDMEVERTLGFRFVFPEYVTRIQYVGYLLVVVTFFALWRGHNLKPWRETLSSVADIACFWPITVQPLGARNYRDEVCAKIESAVQAAGDQCVLVGHSQGSVLCAWVAAERTKSGQNVTAKPYLVTCGSPLNSLYRTFFPAVFGNEFFKLALSGSQCWINVWRSTDPIATALEERLVFDFRVEDPPAAMPEVVRGHSDYWKESIQKSWVAYFLEPLPTRADRLGSHNN